MASVYFQCDTHWHQCTSSVVLTHTRVLPVWHSLTPMYSHCGTHSHPCTPIVALTHTHVLPLWHSLTPVYFQCGTHSHPCTPIVALTHTRVLPVWHSLTPMYSHCGTYSHPCTSVWHSLTRRTNENIPDKFLYSSYSVSSFLSLSTTSLTISLALPVRYCIIFKICIISV